MFRRKQDSSRETEELLRMQLALAHAALDHPEDPMLRHYADRTRFLEVPKDGCMVKDFYGRLVHYQETVRNAKIVHLSDRRK